MNNKKLALAGVILVVVIGIGIMTIMNLDNASASSKSKGNSNQQNSCGNDDLTVDIVCQNFDSKGHGRDNSAVPNATQS